MIAHGAIDQAELARLGLRAEALQDFSSNINPFGPPPSVRAALASLDPAPYPDRSCLHLRQQLAAQHACAIEQLLIGNGSNELIHLIARALLRPGDTVLVVEPTFGEYAHAAALAGAQLQSWRAAERDAFAIDVAALCAAVRRQHPRITWICAPCNPTGATLERAELAQLAEACAAHDGLLLIDRAYHAFERGRHADTFEPPGSGNVVLMHSLTKSYALAGLRLGYLLGEPALLAQIARFQPTWSVSSAAQAAGLAALADVGFLAESLPRVWQASDELCAGLGRLGLPVLRSSLPFMLVRTGDGARTRAALLPHGYMLRDCASFGLPEFVRIAPRQPDANRSLLAVWETLL